MIWGRKIHTHSDDVCETGGWWSPDCLSRGPFQKDHETARVNLGDFFRKRVALKCSDGEINITRPCMCCRIRVALKDPNPKAALLAMILERKYL
jgi:hypothetical protein